LKTTPEATAKAVAMVLRSVARLELILDDFLDLARIEAGRFTLQRKDTDLYALAQEVVYMFTSAAALKKLDLRLVGQPVVVEADGRRLTQVLVNLVSNAIRYTQYGSVTVKVERAPEALEGAQVIVQDTGKGMTQDQVESLFQPFGQVHIGLQEGTGLGLHLAKVIVDAHGGTIHVASPGPNQGINVTVKLPLKDEEKPPNP